MASDSDNALLNSDSESHKRDGLQTLNAKSDADDIKSMLATMTEAMSDMSRAWQSMTSSRISHHDNLQGPPQRKRRKLGNESDSESSSDESDDIENICSDFFKESHNLFPEDTQDDDWRKSLEAKTNDDNEHGPDINETEASLVNKRFLKPQAVEKIQKLQSLYLTPGNCDKIVVPKVNPEIWGKLVQNQNKHVKTEI